MKVDVCFQGKSDKIQERKKGNCSGKGHRRRGSRRIFMLLNREKLWLLMTQNHSIREAEVIYGEAENGQL